MLTEYLKNHDLNSLITHPYQPPYPTCRDREAWDALPREDREEILEEAARIADTPYPMLLCTQFLAFTRTGNRKAYEDPYFLRRRKLILSVLSYCLQGKDEDLDRIVDGVWCILEETSWVLSAHNVDAHPGAPSGAEKPLPDVRAPVIDLFAAQTAMILSLTWYLTGTALDTVSAQIGRRIRLAVEERILTPFETQDVFWWMGFVRRDLNNWTPWIVSNVLLTSALQLTDLVRLRSMVGRGLGMVDRYLETIPEDGGCDEGVAYWNMAGGALMDILQLLREMTDGRMDFSHETKVRKILSFPKALWLGGPWYANFADCDAKPYVCGERLLYAGRYLRDEALMRFGSSRVLSVREEVSDTPQFWRMLNRLFLCERTAGETVPEKDVYLPDLQVRLVSRGGVTVCGKGGHNGENHNHNDVGSLIVYADGEPVIIDIGNLVYTARTFSKQRYELFNTRSRYHTVPEIGGYEQAPGREYTARYVQKTPSGLRLDLAGAYPAEAGVLSCVRTWQVSDAGDVDLSDHVELTEEREVLFALILRNPPVFASPSCFSSGGLRFRVEGMVGHPSEQDSGQKSEYESTIEAIPVEDARLARSYPGTLYRLAFRSPRASRHVMTLHMTKA